MKPLTGLALMGFAVVALGGGLFQWWLAPQLRGPAREGAVLASIQEERASVAVAGFAVPQATVLAESDQSVTLRFQYAGLPQGLALTACGEVTDNGMHGPWGCQPRRLSALDGTVDVHFVLATGARPRECSDRIGISVYGDDGQVVYRHVFSWQKVWHREPGMASWYRYKHEGCGVRHAR